MIFESNNVVADRKFRMYSWLHFAGSRESLVLEKEDD